MQSQQVKLWNKDFILIIVINFLVFMNHLMILSTFPFYIEYLGGSEAVAGFAAALFSIIAVVFRPFIGWMLDNGKRKIILIIGLCGMALMPIGYLVFATLYLAFVCRMPHGASLAFSNTSTSTIATDIIPKPRFAEGMGMFGLATALVFMQTYGALENFTAKFAAEQNLPSGGIFFAVMAVALLLTRLLAGNII